MIRVEGGEDFSRVARELKDAGRQDLRKEMFRALQSSTKPARQQVLDDIPDFMPGDYAATLAGDLRLSATAKGGKDPSIRMRAKGKRKNRFVAMYERGNLRHPLYGNRGRWFNQSIEPGWFSAPLRAQAPQINEQLTEAMQRVAQQIADEGST